MTTTGAPVLKLYGVFKLMPQRFVSSTFSGVTVGSLAPAASGSSVSTLAKLLPETVPWLETCVASGGTGLAITASNTMVIDLPAGKTPMDRLTVSACGA